MHFYTSDIHPVHVVYLVWSIFNRWYMTCTLLYIRHTPCTCRIRGIGPYIDTWPHLYIRHTPCRCCIRGIGHIQPVIHRLYTFIHQTYPVHVVYMRYWAIFNRIHNLYTFIHQTFTLHMLYTRYWAIFQHGPCTLLYIRHTPCTCRIHSIGPYSTIDT